MWTSIDNPRFGLDETYIEMIYRTSKAVMEASSKQAVSADMEIPVYIRESGREPTRDIMFSK